MIAKPNSDRISVCIECLQPLDMHGFCLKEYNMIHTFDVNIAVEYGINAAVLLQNIGYWIKQNEANELNYFDGCYWTFNSRRAYKELFPYMSERQINTAFQKLIDNDLIVTGHYNKLAYDRTLWYALTQKGKCILHFDIMENVKMSNGECQNVEPIPNVNTNNKHIYLQIKDLYNETCVSFPRLTALSDKRKQTIKARLNSYSFEQIKEVFKKAEASDFLKGKNNRDWQANFDWLMKDSNFAKVLDGNYDNKKVDKVKVQGAAYDLELFEKMLNEDD